MPGVKSLPPDVAPDVAPDDAADLRATAAGGATLDDPAPPLTPEQAEWVRRNTLPPPESAVGDGPTKWPRAKALAFLTSCPQLPVFVPLGFDEINKPGDHTCTVIWNGWGWTFPKGKTAYVPQPIAEIIEQGQQPVRTKQFRDQRPWDCVISSDPHGKRVIGG